MHEQGPNLLFCLASGELVRLTYVARTPGAALMERVERFLWPDGARSPV
jgi:hypothetical protein